MSDSGPTTPVVGAPVSVVSRGRMVVVLGLLSTFGPLSLDLYLPALPALAADLGSSTSAAQATLTACLLGLAVGQLAAGPLSDRIGRRWPLLAGLLGYLVCSLGCAFAPSIEVLIAVRFLQGWCGAAGLVVSRAVVRDLYGGRELVVFLSRLMLVNALAPILAPLIGGQLAHVMSWRGMFLVLAGFGAVLLVAGLLVPETLPTARRTEGGVAAAVRGYGVLVRDRLFIGAAASAGLAFAAMFAYIAGATFVLQSRYGLSPQQFSYAFGVNSIGILLLGQVTARLARRHPPALLLAVAVAQNLAGASLAAAALLAGWGLFVVLAGLFVMVSAVGMILPTATAIALLDHPERAGAASSLLGLGQYVAGAVAAPLVGVAGRTSAAPLALVMLVASTAAAVVVGLVLRPGGPKGSARIRTAGSRGARRAASPTPPD